MLPRLAGLHQHGQIMLRPYIRPKPQPPHQLQEKPEMKRQIMTRAAVAVPVLSVLLELKPAPRMAHVAI